ncbi:helix-turn-helix domain-containing protein [Yersinia enterocolitica]|uniref:helix-turn-helix domain-containing protein n=1 Tax=Yersinia enterocolitica TaxID=630 RepID=UPI001C8DAAF0|nr:helix-turn-helix transcriptional regulator [Yersinia enterocolitica]MBX9476803.1 helix-turn-helix transcriptional regulator [Yersinia enterocolitica]
MKLTIAEKITLMRESERITSRVKAAELIDIPSNALWRYETGEAIPKGDIIIKILGNPTFEKYALWFVTGKTAPEVGQIAPALYNPDNYEQDDEKTA